MAKINTGSPETLVAEVTTDAKSLHGPRRRSQTATIIRAYMPAIRESLLLGHSLLAIHARMKQNGTITVTYKNFWIHATRLLAERASRTPGPIAFESLPTGQKRTIISPAVKPTATTESPRAAPRLNAETAIPTFTYNPTPNLEDLI